MLPDDWAWAELLVYGVQMTAYYLTTGPCQAHDTGDAGLGLDEKLVSWLAGCKRGSSGC